MHIEFEATFIDIDIDKFRAKLKAIGAKLIKPETLMRRVVSKTLKHLPGGWLRVLDEGDKVTMSIKQNTGDKIEDQKEVCLTIDNFDEGVLFLKAMDAEIKAYQETKREEWHYKNCEITIDTWPGLDPFIEVEAKTEAEVKEASKDLDLDYSQALFGAVHVVYEKKLGIPPKVINDETPEITFANPPKRYNKD